MPPLYPLRFAPILRRYIWGGRRLGTLLKKPIAEGENWAESWEIVDHGEDQTRVAAGPLEGTTLHELVTGRGAELLGRHHPQPRFPLLFKFLDAQQNLSVQVHPDDARAARLTPPDLGKTEAWVVIAAEPGSKIYSGLKRGFDRDSLAREVDRGTTTLCLHSWEPKLGDCAFIPAGTVHALGAGLVIAEIQQSSDVTWRLFDWNRVGTDGKSRPLHIQESLEAIDYKSGPVNAATPRPTIRPHAERLVDCDKFRLDRWRLTGQDLLGGDNTCRIVAVLGGQARIDGDASDGPLTLGQTVLLPACCGPLKVSGEKAELMVIELP